MPLPHHFKNIHILRTIIINAVTLGVAAGLAANRRRNPDIPPRSWPAGEEAPPVQVIIPARNEERNIPALLKSLLAQEYPQGRWGVTVVDDHSEDDTLALACEFACEHPDIAVVSAPPLPDGWTGKSNAMYAGMRSAPPDPEWLLFVDADTRHAPLMLSSVILRATESGANMLSLVIDVEMVTFWERVLVPQVGELYTLLVGTMDDVNRDQSKAAANGQFILVRRSLFAKVAALSQVRGDVAEDRALAQALKDRGCKVRLEYGRGLVRARVYSSLREMWAGYSKTLFWASGHNLPRALAAALALALYALLPPLALVVARLSGNDTHGRNRLLAALLQMGPMFALRAAVCRRLGIPTVYALTYPLGVAVGDAILFYSIYRVLSGKGVQWKGRTYR
jgi:chlorobactene glucosyltransferase